MRLAITRALALGRRVRGLALVLVGVLLGIGIPGPEQREPLLNSSVQSRADTDCPANLKEMRRERRQLQEEVAYLKQSVIVEQQACFKVRESLVKLQAEMSRLREQVAFYRGIVSPEETTAGVRVHDLVIGAVKPGVYHYRLTLLQSVREGGDSRGTVQMQLEVIDGDSVRNLNLEQLLLDGEGSPDYEFRYYTELFGEFALDDGLEPLRLTVRLRPAGRGAVVVKRTFVWDELLAEDPAKESGS